MRAALGSKTGEMKNLLCILALGVHRVLHDTPATLIYTESGKKVDSNVISHNLTETYHNLVKF